MVDVVVIAFVAPYMAYVASTLTTLLHSLQELRDEGAPIWEYLGLRASYPVGLAGLAAFAGFQVFLAHRAYLGGLTWAYWTLLAVRLGDSVLSHWVPWLCGRRPNPGLATTVYYALEAVAIVFILVRHSHG